MLADSVLIIRMSAFGDIICALPTLRALKDSYPEMRIGWIIDERFEDLIRHEPAVDEVIVIPMNRWLKQARKLSKWTSIIGEMKQLYRHVHNMDYQVCLDLQGINKSGIVSRVAHCQRTLQMAEDHLKRLQWLFPGERVSELGIHAVDRMRALAGALGADVSHVRFNFHIPEQARAYAEDLFQEMPCDSNTGPVIALNPATSAPHRMWPAERFSMLAARLTKEIGAQVVVLGGPAEVALSEGIVRESGVPCLCTAGRTNYLQLGAVLQCCDIIVSGDTGPMHLAAALNKPVVTLIGPSNPTHTGPYGDMRIILQKHLPCQPCYGHPTCNDYACMKSIEVDDVFDAVVTGFSRSSNSFTISSILQGTENTG